MTTLLSSERPSEPSDQAVEKLPGARCDGNVRGESSVSSVGVSETSTRKQKSTDQTAASSSGRAESPARYLTIESPANCQTMTTKIVHRAQVGSPVQGRTQESSPASLRPALSGPE